MENTQHTIIPRNIISFLSTSRSWTNGLRCDNKNNKIKKILQTYGLWGRIDANILEFARSTWGCVNVQEMEVSSSKLVNNELRRIYRSDSGAHSLPVMNISVEEFVKLYNTYEDFEIINNSFGIPSIIFGRNTKNKPIVMPIINWDNLPESINPYGEPVYEDKELDSFVEIALPPQMLHKIEFKENGLLHFAPETAPSFKYETPEVVQQQMDEFFKSCKFFDIPIACTPRRYKLSDAEKLIRMTKVDQSYKMFVQQENLLIPFMTKTQEDTTKLATALKNEVDDRTKNQREISRSLGEVRHHAFYEDLTEEDLLLTSATAKAANYDPDLYADDFSINYRSSRGRG